MVLNQIIEARKGNITEVMKAVAADECLPVEFIQQGLAEGTIVVPANPCHQGVQPCGVGKGLRTKVNANIGTSQDQPLIKLEMEKMKAATDARTDTLMDLSTGGDINEIRCAILQQAKIPLGTVPIYQAVIETIQGEDSLANLKKETIFSVLEKQMSDGVDFVTLHCGVTREALERIRKEGRITNVISRGGAFIVEWMIYNDKENPLYEHFDRVIDIALKYDVTLSLGDGMRPGCLADATDRAQVQELIVLGELAQRALEAGVQVMIEGPGHIPLHQIETNVQLEKELCHGAPFYVLGPLVTDVAPGYDHITAAIGGALAAAKGADFLCYVTPSEHLRLPTVDDIREGVITTRIAAHAADIAKGVKGACEWDEAVSRKRVQRHWQELDKLCLDPEKVKKYREASVPLLSDVCTMCGEFCSIKRVEEYFKKKE